MCDPLVKLFQNSIWIVPSSTLRAYLITGENEPKAVIDQTVWIIDSYSNGYIFGTSYASLDRVPVSKRKLIGSITPQGDVLISFYSDSDSNVITGSGKFEQRDRHRCKRDSWQFIMQMNQVSTLTISHWSYMVRTSPRKETYHHLPGVGISVPEFIKKFEDLPK